MTADTEDMIIMVLDMGQACFALMSIKHIHTRAQKQKQRSQLLLFTAYSRRLIGAFHEPCNQRGRGGEEKTTITERSVVKLWTGLLLL